MSRTTTTTNEKKNPYTTMGLVTLLLLCFHYTFHYALWYGVFIGALTNQPIQVMTPYNSTSDWLNESSPQMKCKAPVGLGGR